MKQRYEFWKRKVRARITDPEKKELLAPTEPPHAFGGKRPSLEQDFYEQMDKPQVKIINIRQNPVSQVVPKGIVTSDGQVHEFDVIALATGFDSFTGSLKEIDIEGLNGVTVKEKWKLGTWTYLGMTISGIPNVRSSLVLNIMHGLRLSWLTSRSCSSHTVRKPLRHMPTVLLLPSHRVNG